MDEIATRQLTASDAARLLGCPLEWVLEYQTELGGVRLDNGALRFDPDALLERAAQLPRKARPR